MPLFPVPTATLNLGILYPTAPVASPPTSPITMKSTVMKVRLFLIIQHTLTLYSEKHSFHFVAPFPPQGEGLALATEKRRGRAGEKRKGEEEGGEGKEKEREAGGGGGEGGERGRSVQEREGRGWGGG